MTIHPDGLMAAQLVAPIGTEPAAPMVASFDNGTVKDGQSPCDGRQLLSVQTDLATSSEAPDVGVVSRASDVGTVFRAPDVGADSRAPDVETVFRVSQTNFEETSEFCSAVRDGKV